MRFVVVNHRVPKVNNYCALCTATLEDGYLREMDTQIKYCGFGCFTEHLLAAANVFNAPKLLTYEKGGLR